MSDLPTINLALYAQTDVGMVRSGNEDNFLILDLSSCQSWTANEEEPHDLLTYTQGYYGTLLAVSDGMGGALAGEVASRIAVETVRDRMLQLQAHDNYSKVPFSERLRLAVEEANAVIHTDGQTNQAHRGLGATFTAVATNDNHLYFAQVGDSRAHLIRQGKIYRITKDQSLVQQLIDAGQITEEEAETHSYRNVILQALGAHNNVNVEVNGVSLCQLDTLVLCSDGLSGKIPADEIARIVNEASDFQSACQSLINLANERGGEDNITVVIAQLSGAGLPLPDDDSMEPKSLARSPDTPTEISWASGAKTNPMDEVEIPTQKPSGGEIRKTEPLPSPPKQSTSFTAPLTRSSPVLKRTNDLSDRVGPITSVFAPEELSEAAEEESRVTAEASPPQYTAPLDPHLTRSLSATSQELPAQEDFSTPRASLNNHDGTLPEKKSSKINLTIFIGLVLLGIAGLALTATTYFKQQAAEKSAQKVADDSLKTENKTRKESKVKSLSDQMAKIERDIQAIDKPNLQGKRDDLMQRLTAQRDRLKELDQIADDQFAYVTERCDDISQKLTEIETELRTLQGLIPSRITARAPIKI
ncbi:MAG: protein phosphatase 2C domain-containing protein [Blastocatellia bacterium]